jgi:hypothetical protein
VEVGVDVEPVGGHLGILARLLVHHHFPEFRG